MSLSISEQDRGQAIEAIAMQGRGAQDQDTRLVL